MKRNIQVATIQMQAIDDLTSILILHCQVEKDRIRHTQQLMEKMEGIVEMELLESKMTNLIKTKTGSC